MKNNEVKFSVVSPVYGAASSLKELVERIHSSVSQITDNYEIILVEDNSPDNSWQIIKDLSKTDSNVVGLSMSRNFGQQNAINAGLDYATGDWVVTLDCDLQDEPERIIDMYSEALKGYDVVFASRMNRQDSFMKKLFSKLFYSVMSYLTETIQDNSIANFVLYNRNVVQSMARVGDYYRYYPILNHWVGFRTTKLPIPHASRKDDKNSSYTFKKRLRLAYTTILAFSDKPLRLVLKLGITMVAICFLLALYYIIRYITNDIEVSGWLSLFLSLWLLSGIMIIILGLIGVYVGKIFDATKNRPTYLLKEIAKQRIT
jgi:glycosyltransferase involved in cell wall biosynthesis